MKLKDCDFKNDTDREAIKAFKRTMKDLYSLGMVKKNKHSMCIKSNEELAKICNTKKGIRTPSQRFNYFFPWIYSCTNSGILPQSVRILYIIRLIKALNYESLTKRFSIVVKNSLNGSVFFYDNKFVNPNERVFIDSYSDYLEKTICEIYPEISKDQIRIFFKILKNNIRYPDIPF